MLQSFAQNLMLKNCEYNTTFFSVLSALAVLLLCGQHLLVAAAFAPSPVPRPQALYRARGYRALAPFTTAAHCRATPRLDAASHGDEAAQVLEATEAWLTGWVINLQLCPWASMTKGTNARGAPYTRTLLLHDDDSCLDDHAAAVLREARALQQRAREGEDGFNGFYHGFYTTLFVFPDKAFAGQGPVERNCGAFPVYACA